MLKYRNIVSQVAMYNRFKSTFHIGHREILRLPPPRSLGTNVAGWARSNGWLPLPHDLILATWDNDHHHHHHHHHHHCQHHRHCHPHLNRTISRKLGKEGSEEEMMMKHMRLINCREWKPVNPCNCTFRPYILRVGKIDIVVEDLEIGPLHVGRDYEEREGGRQGGKI